MSREIVLVEYFFSDTRLLGFVVRANLDQPKVITITTDVERLRADILEGPPTPKHTWAEVVARPSLTGCIEPLLEWISPDDIICFVPSGELFYVPMHAVPVAGAPLIVRNPVFYAPGASTLRYCVRRRRTPGSEARRATVFGDPTYDLAHTVGEAEKVAAFLGVSPLLRYEASRARWLDSMSVSDIIHYAGHARFDETDPLASCLFLNDGPLTARDLFGTAGAALRLVTLSGCQTGVNRIHAGDELLGLTRALLYAGASSLLLTLWPIFDRTSAALMIEFYDRWLNRGELKVDALRHAQMQMLQEGEQNPYYWAPFVLVGDWA